MRSRTVSAWRAARVGTPDRAEEIPCVGSYPLGNAAYIPAKSCEDGLRITAFVAERGLERRGVASGAP